MSPEGESKEISDLIGVELTLVFTGWILATLACFFFVGVVVGMILVALGLLGFGWWVISTIREADVSD